ncbi:MAG TPA: FadR/GntR family transcriptional regulator [Paracoccus sp. (in: a-proteobacteria)]|uniref:FadR/GntR family transcriptional regulator n=1 Tax=Paracoccus sp. TaxID=267 RepID=UPI002BBB861C|nr:FadR/GntR family transcriptional regulator [Paracoccus sp. (in: a-proteobacteria)]HWL58488.1 FadR/GntR family transcriptional regulator [Paracoccus sp. (in: a-proteobacteria)]
MAQEFKQIARNEHLPARIASQFAEHIHNGTIKPGDKLPTEHSMAQTFGVSRTVIREAIAQLRNEGLVETRQGVGAFVVERPARPIRLGDGGQMDKHAFSDLFQLRVPLEIEAAGLAAVHRTDEQMRVLDAALHRMAVSQDWNTEGVAADLEFHRIIAVATGNEYFDQFIGAIADRVGHVIIAAREQLLPERIKEITIAEHGAIRDAIFAREPLAARSAMRQHLTGSAKRVGLELEFFN